MDVLCFRTRPAHLSTLLLRASPTLSQNAARSTSPPLFRPRRPTTYAGHNPRDDRTMMTTAPRFAQAAARRREPEPEEEPEENDENDEDPEEDDEQSRRSRRQMSTQDNVPSPPLSSEPTQRTAMPEHFLAGRRTEAIEPIREAPAAPTSTGKRPAVLSFLQKAAINRNLSPTPTQKPLFSQGQTSDQSQPIRSDRSTPLDFLEANKDKSVLNFLQKDRPSRAQDGSSPITPTSKTFVGGSLQDLLNNMRTTTSLPGSTPSPTPRFDPNAPPRPSPFGRMEYPTSSLPSPNRPAAYVNPAPTLVPDLATLLGRRKDSDLEKPTFRINASLGRTQPVTAERGVDVARAFKMVDIKCSVSGVRMDVYSQAFHERGGTKRKRLRMLRWRRRFKAGFSQTVRRVEDMRRKGW